MTVAIEAQDLFRVHSTPEGDAAALQGLTLSVAEGEILTVLGPSERRFCPKTRIVPADGRSRPARMRRNEVLPAPLGPSTVRISLSSTFRVSP